MIYYQKIKPHNMLKTLRNIGFLNKTVRVLLKKFSVLLYKLSFKWRVSGKVTVRFDGKKIFFFAKCDDGIIDTLFYGREYIEFSELNLFVQIAKKSNTIVDIGANTGVYSILSAKCNENALIYAIEPNPINQIRLKKNIQLNNLLKIKIIGNAIGGTTKTVSFTVPDNDIISDTSSVLPEFSKLTYVNEIKWKEITVFQNTLDDLFKENKDKIDLIKIDVEGYEINVFEGAKSFFYNNSPIIICEIFLDNEKRKYFNKFLEEYDYIAYLVLKEGVLRLDKTLIPNLDGLNFLFSRGKTDLIFTSFKNTDKLIDELMDK